MTPEQLKAGILQLAIQGRLVPQRPEEGTAEELYKEIQREKKKLFAQGKIKKQKPLPPISEDEIPFDIPETWKWVRWGEIVNIVSARRVHQSDWKTSGVPFYRAREIAVLDVKGEVDNDLFISQELYAQLSKTGLPKPGDLMVTAVGTLGKTYIVKPQDSFYYKDASVICLENVGHVVPEYLKYAIKSEMMRSQIRSNSDGTTVATLTIVRMRQYLLPLPPLDEQKRIVAKIEQTLPLIERYGEAYTALETLDKRFPEDMRKSILQYAIQGKLVPQRPEEGSAEDLYKQIQQEKKKLIAAGKIKKEKPLPPIKEDEIPFDIPDAWKWVRLGDLGYFVRGSGIKKTEVTEEGYPCVRYGQLYTTYKGSFKEAVSKIPHELFMSSKKASKGDVLMALTGENKEDIATAVVYEGDEPIAIGGDMTTFTPIGVTPLYLATVINSPYGVSEKRKRATGDIIVHTSNDKLAQIAIPVPPSDEENRIVRFLIGMVKN